jgi:hypothetical protein
MMLGFIDTHGQEYGVEPICDVLPMAPSTVRLHAARKADTAKLSARAQRDIGLKSDIRRVFDENFQVYGVHKVWRQLQREGIQVARCTVEQMMRVMGLRGAIRGKPIKTTVADKALPCPLDRVNRQFRADRPDQLWLSDFMHVSTWSGFVYVAFIIDAFAWQIVGRPGNPDWFTIRTEAANICPSDTLSGWAWLASNRRSAVSAIHTTMPWPKPSTVSTRRKSSIGEGHGNPLKPWNTRSSNGSTGSTTAACSNLSEIFRQPRRNNAIMTP